MNRKQIIKALKTLSRNLEKKGIRGDIYLLGGAALIIAYNAKKETKDVDAVFLPKSEIRKAAEEVANVLNLKKDWLNDAVKGYLSNKPDQTPVVVLDEPGLRVMSASAEYLLAMKLLSARREDEADIKFLCDYLGIKSSMICSCLGAKFHPKKFADGWCKHKLFVLTQTKLDDVVSCSLLAYSWLTKYLRKI